MKIEKNRVVAIDYTLTDNDGIVIDSSIGRAPLTYLHGVGALISGLEKELEGKGVGDKLEVSIHPSEGYGLRNEELQQSIPREHFPPDADIQLGMQFEANTEQGPLVVTVMEVHDDKIVADGNHPLAGVILNFKVEVKEVRAASEDEIAHGHVH